MISIIVAMSQNRVIGREGQIPWHLSEDLQRFKKITMGHPLVMGRKTFESLGKPLPGRENIVISRNPDFKPQGVTLVSNLKEALGHCKPDEEIFVMGGGEIFSETLPQVDKIYLTLIDDEFEGDTFFPSVDLGKEFKVLEETPLLMSEKDQLPYKFLVMQRKGKN